MKALLYCAIILSLLSISSLSFACPTNKKVLIVGDSHMNMAFGNKLISLFSKNNDVISYGVCAASTESILHESKTKCGFTIKSGTDGVVKEIVKKWKSSVSSFEQILLTQNPNVVVIVLGTNNIFDGNTSFMTTLSLINLANKHHQELYWIGPPNIIGYTSQFRMIIAALQNKNVNYVDSKAFNKRAPLNIQDPHFDKITGQKWATWSFHGLGCQ